MAVQTFSDVVSQADSKIAASIVSKALDINPHFRRIPLITANNRLTHRRLKEGQKPAMESRSFNADFPTKQKATFDPSETHLKPMGAKFEIDRKFRKNGTVQGKTNLQAQMDAFSMSLFEDLPDKMFNGDETVAPVGEEFNGFKAFLTALYPDRFSLYDEGAGNTNGILIADPESLVSALDALMEDGPDFVYLPRPLMHRINSAFANAGNSVIASKYRKQWVINPQTGAREHYGATYEDTPLIYPGQNSQGAFILGMDETVGTSDITGSMYAVKWGENFAYMLQDEPPEITESIESGMYVTRFDWLLSLDIVNKKGIKAVGGFLV